MMMMGDGTKYLYITRVFIDMSEKNYYKKLHSTSDIS